MTLVMTSRTDPGFPISRLRARGQLLELRASDLRFTQAETSAFLQQTMNLTLTPDQITALENRTEGWVAGLQMAALSMQNRTDVAGFIESFTGSHRFIMDYLLEEVLNQQPAEVQAFLLDTAVLDRFCAELCDAVRQTTNSQEILHQLDAENLFLIPLDNERHWYRYHHLFAEILQQRRPQATTDLHLRASQWYEENQLEIEAFHHAAVAGDTVRAERLMAGNGVPLYLRGGGTAIFKWLATLPAEMLNQQPSLLLSYASALTYVGKANEAEPYLQTAKKLLESKALLDPRERDMLGQINALEAMKGISHNDFAAIITHSEQALENLLPENQTARTTAAWAMGYAHQVQGNRTSALRAYHEVIAISEASGNRIFLMGAQTGVGQIQEAQNELFAAVETYHEVIRIAGNPPDPPACEGHRGLAHIYYEWNQLDKAAEHAKRGYEIAITIDGIDTPATCQRIWARILLAQGDEAGAAKLLAEGERFLREHQFDHEMPEQAAVQVHLLLRQNQLTAASELAQRYDIPLTQARVYLAQGNPTAALHILAPHRPAVETKQWADEQLKTIIMQALAYQANGKQDTAVQHLNEALALAQPHGFVRTFIDEGEPMARLLTAVPRTDYIDTLLAAFPATANPSPTPQTLVDPLSERELEILTHIAAGLRNKEIAAQLFVSINTVHYHTKNLYGKLGVNNRTQAIAKAQELNLL
jgi:LuxR family maltose regulon positive regulatory protein